MWLALGKNERMHKLFQASYISHILICVRLDVNDCNVIYNGQIRVVMIGVLPFWSLRVLHRKLWCLDVN